MLAQGGERRAAVQTACVAPACGAGRTGASAVMISALRARPSQRPWRLGCLPAILILASLAPAQGRSSSFREAPLRWMAVSALPSERDRILATSLRRDCGGACQGGSALEAALVPLGRNRTLLLVRFPSGGTCGAYEIGLFGPVGRNGRRLSGRDPAEPALLNPCGERIAVRPRGRTLPEIVTTAFVERHAERGPVLETTIWRWTGRLYAIAHRFRARMVNG